jgi:hypothetical protein
LTLAVLPVAARSERLDGALSPADARFAFDVFLVGDSGPMPDVRTADANCDGEVTPGDALAIYERYLRDLPAPPCFAADDDGAVSRRALHLHHRAVASLPGASARYEVALAVDSPRDFSAFGLRLTYPLDALELISIDASADTEDWIAVEAIERTPGEVIAGGFNTGPIANAEPIVLMRLVFAVHAQEVDGRRVAVDMLRDDLAGTEVISDAGTHDASHPTPTSYGLRHSMTGDPVRSAVIRLDVPAGKDRARLRLAVHDGNGRLVRVLVDDTRDPGFYEIVWDRTDESGVEVPSGVYYCRLQTHDLIESTKVVVH